MFTTTSSGSFKNTMAFLEKASKIDISRILEVNGQKGVDALSSATPVRTGLASNSWFYRVEKTGAGYSLSWHNSDVENGFPVAIMIQVGHGTGTGGYVQGIDYINPAIRPIFEDISREIMKAVTSA